MYEECKGGEGDGGEPWNAQGHPWCHRQLCQLADAGTQTGLNVSLQTIQSNNHHSNMDQIEEEKRYAKNLNKTFFIAIYFCLI